MRIFSKLIDILKDLIKTRKFHKFKDPLTIHYLSLFDINEGHTEDSITIFSEVYPEELINLINKSRKMDKTSLVHHHVYKNEGGIIVNECLSYPGTSSVKLLGSLYSTEFLVIYKYSFFYIPACQKKKGQM